MTDQRKGQSHYGVESGRRWGLLLPPGPGDMGLESLCSPTRPLQLGGGHEPHWAPGLGRAEI